MGSRTVWLGGAGAAAALTVASIMWQAHAPAATRAEAGIHGGAAAPPAPTGFPSLQVVEVPLRVREGLLVVPVRGPGGRELAFALSTGTAVTVLSESVAMRLGLDAELSLGGIPLEMLHARALPDAELARGGETVDGLVGPNTLNAFDVLVDAPGGRLLLRPVERGAPWDGVSLSDPVRLRVYHGIVLGLDVELNGRRYPAMLELGTPRVLASEAVLREAEEGDDDGWRLGIGRRVWDDVEVRRSDHPVIRRFAPGGEGFVLVGSSVVLECALSLSWARQELRTCAP